MCHVMCQFFALWPDLLRKVYFRRKEVVAVVSFTLDMKLIIELKLIIVYIEIFLQIVLPIYEITVIYFFCIINF